MIGNVGSNERYGWLALGILAGAAAVRARGWQRTVLGALAAAGLGTALTGYSPVARALGRTRTAPKWPLDQGLRDTELRRHAAMRSALGTAPTTDSGQPRVTPDADVFGRPQ